MDRWKALLAARGTWAATHGASIDRQRLDENRFDRGQGGGGTRGESAKRRGGQPGGGGGRRDVGLPCPAPRRTRSRPQKTGRSIAVPTIEEQGKGVGEDRDRAVRRTGVGRAQEDTGTQCGKKGRRRLILRLPEWSSLLPTVVAGPEKTKAGCGEVELGVSGDLSGRGSEPKLSDSGTCRQTTPQPACVQRKN